MLPQFSFLSIASLSIAHIQKLCIITIISVSSVTRSCHLIEDLRTGLHPTPIELIAVTYDTLIFSSTVVLWWWNITPFIQRLNCSLDTIGNLSTVAKGSTWLEYDEYDYHIDGDREQFKRRKGCFPSPVVMKTLASNTKFELRDQCGLTQWPKMIKVACIVCCKIWFDRDKFPNCLCVESWWDERTNICPKFLLLFLLWNRFSFQEFLSWDNIIGGVKIANSDVVKMERRARLWVSKAKLVNMPKPLCNFLKI